MQILVKLNIGTAHISPSEGQISLLLPPVSKQAWQKYIFQLKSVKRLNYFPTEVFAKYEQRKSNASSSNILVGICEGHSLYMLHLLISNKVP